MASITDASGTTLQIFIFYFFFFLHSSGIEADRNVACVVYSISTIRRCHNVIWMEKEILLKTYLLSLF